jgi:hypothetical protein
MDEMNSVQITDINGKEIIKLSVASQEIYNLDISNLEKGLYLIRSLSEKSGKSFTSKFIKE